MKDIEISDKDPWKHRGKGMRCETCMWFALKAVATSYDVKTDTETTKTSGIGRCRRRAPTMNGYPVVFCADWCGDHKLDEVKV